MITEKEKRKYTKAKYKISDTIRKKQIEWAKQEKEAYEAGKAEVISSFAEKIKKRLFVNPEPCCHGVREKEAFEIIDKLVEEQSSGDKK